MFLFITGSSYSFSLTNGTYSYTIATADKTESPTPSSGNFSVKGAPVSETITFLKVTTYTVTFSESGLPLGTTWSVALNGATHSSVSGTISFSELNGSYSYSVSSVPGYTVSTPTEIVTVDGHNISVSITFEKVGSAPVWAFPGAYANYSITGTNGSLKVDGYATVSIYRVNYTTGSVNTSLLISGTGFGTEMIYQNGSWNSFPFNFLYNGTQTSQLNNGTMPPQLNESFDAPYHIYTGVKLTTDLGVFMTDEIVLINAQRLPVLTEYVSQYSGVVLKYHVLFPGNNEQPENLTAIVESSNIPLQSSSGSLNLSITPSSAQVLVNGVILSLHSGNELVSLNAGTYYVSASDAGYMPYFKEVNISAGKVSYLNITLSRSSVTTYTLSGYVTPGNASVVVGNIVAQVSPSGHYSISIPSGNYTVSVSAPGYYSATRVMVLNSNIANENFTLKAEPQLTSSKTLLNVTADGYNVTIASITSGSGKISIQYTATVNGTLTVTIPYSQVRNATIGEILNSSVYINGTRYTDFTVAVSVQGGNYSVVLTVNNLSNDPTLEWLYSPAATPPGHSSSAPLPPYVLDIVFAVVIAVIAIAGVMVVRRKK